MIAEGELLSIFFLEMGDVGSGSLVVCVDGL